MDVLDVPVHLRLSRIRGRGTVPRHGGGETWRRLKVTFPDRIATHCPEQIFYFDSNGLLRRHDYTPEVINAGPAAHYPSEYKEFDGMMIPTRRRVYRRGEGGTVSRDVELVTIDVESVLFV